MAVQIIKRLLSDVSGEEATQTIQFAIEGRDYIIDVTDAEHLEFWEKISLYVEAGKRNQVQSKATGLSALPRRSPPRVESEPGVVVNASKQKRDKASYLADVRSWAAEKNISVAPRGRVPVNVLDMYENRHVLEAAAIAEAAEKANAAHKKDTLDVVRGGTPVKANGQIIQTPAGKTNGSKANGSKVPAPVFSAPEQEQPAAPPRRRTRVSARK